MLVLAVDTSTKFSSIALLDDKTCLYELSFLERKTHSAHLITDIINCLKTQNLTVKDVELFVSSIGPGSFTGVRIGLSTLKALGYALKKPVTGVQSLRALAMNLIPANTFAIPILDARKKEIYSAIYKIEDGEIREIYPPSALSPQRATEIINNFIKKDEEIWILGDGVSLYSNIFFDSLGKRLRVAPPSKNFIRASNIGIEGLRLYKENGAPSLFELSPLYIRASEAELKKNL